MKALGVQYESPATQILAAAAVANYVVSNHQRGAGGALSRLE